MPYAAPLCPLAQVPTPIPVPAAPWLVSFRHSAFGFARPPPPRRDLRLLTSPELLAISQDAGAKQARRVFHGPAVTAGGTPVWWDSGKADVQVWRKVLFNGDTALLLFNAGDRPADIRVRWKELLAAESMPWEEEQPRTPPCADRLDMANCKQWAAAGECDRNPGFMRGACALSCDACPPLLWEGRHATALVRDAWEEEYARLFTAFFTAPLVEPHGAVVVTVRFGPVEHLRRILEEDRRQQLGRRSRASPEGGGATTLVAHGLAAAESIDAVGDGAAGVPPRPTEETAHGIAQEQPAGLEPRSGSRGGDSGEADVPHHLSLLLAAPVAAICGLLFGRRTRAGVDRRSRRGARLHL
jgi:hypothetical protein